MTSLPWWVWATVIYSVIGVALGLMIWDAARKPVDDRDRYYDELDRRLDEDAGRLCLIEQARDREDREVAALGEIPVARGRMSMSSPWKAL